MVSGNAMGNTIRIAIMLTMRIRYLCDEPYSVVYDVYYGASIV